VPDNPPVLLVTELSPRTPAAEGGWYSRLFQSRISRFQEGRKPMSTASQLSRTPLYECHQRAGGKIVDFAGWELPVQYSGLMEEHRAVRTMAGLFDVSHMGEFRVSGREAEQFLQRLTPNDVSRLTPGRIHYSGLLTDTATYVDDLLVYRLADEEFLLVVNAANADKDLAWIADRRPAGVEVEDVSGDYALLALQGPAAEAILADLTDVVLPDMRYYRFEIGTVGGHQAIVSRTGYTGEDGFELYLSPVSAADVWDRLLKTGKERGLVPAGLGARDTLRLEAAMALYGHEIDDTTTPLEAGLGWVVKWNKGDFLGRDALLAQKESGIERQLIGFELTGRGIARQGYEVLVSGEPVGKVTSGSFSPTLEKAIGMAYLPVDFAEPGTEIEIQVRKNAVAGVVVPLPFYKRSN
jgi:aminomethyltransferase